MQEVYCIRRSLWKGVQRASRPFGGGPGGKAPWLECEFEACIDALEP